MLHQSINVFTKQFCSDNSSQRPTTTKNWYYHANVANIPFGHAIRALTVHVFDPIGTQAWLALTHASWFNFKPTIISKSNSHAPFFFLSYKTSTLALAYHKFSF